MLAVKRSAGVAPEVNLTSSVQGESVQARSTLALKHGADVTRSPKQGYQWPHKKDMCPPKILENLKKKKVAKLSGSSTDTRLWVHF